MIRSFKLFGLNLVILFILLLIIDPFLAPEKSNYVKTYRSLGLREYGPNRDITLFPSGHEIDTALFDSLQYRLQTNNAGFIIGPNQPINVKCKLLFFGGSTTECAFVDDSLRFPFLVGKELGIMTGNAGYGGNHSFHSLINLLGKGLTEKPEIVVWMHNINDLSLLSKTGSYYISPGNRKVLDVSTQQAKPTYMQRLKNLANAFIQATVPNLFLKIKQVGKPQSGDFDEWEGFRDLPKVDEVVIRKTFRASLQTFVHTAQAHHIQVVLMTQFNRINSEDQEVMQHMRSRVGNYTDEEFVKIYHGLNQIIREVALNENVALIDLAMQVPPTPTYLYDAVHLNNAGSKLVAKIIAENLMALKHRKAEVASGTD